MRGGLRRKSHSPRGGGEAYLDFELKDHGLPEAAALRAVLDFKVQTRPGPAARRLGRDGPRSPRRKAPKCAESYRKCRS